jgi:hypothetical protein
MVETILVTAPLAYCAIGAVVVAAAFLATPEGERPDFGDALSILLVGMICWPVLVWAFFHSGDE